MLPEFCCKWVDHRATLADVAATRPAKWEAACEPSNGGGYAPETCRAGRPRSRRLWADILFKALAETLITIAADPKHLGARIGLTSVFHQGAGVVPCV